MENDKLPYISVIITAYNRKDFLLNAIKSALNQTLDKKYYEVIVIKNFEDKNLDEFINKNKIIGIISNNKSLGGKLSEALNIARGTVISFLEDDDLFFENKLEIVYKEFKRDDDIVYYHNLWAPINKNGKTININTMNISPDINMSSISIKRSIVKVNNANNIPILSAPDVLMYVYALESNKKIRKGKEILTYYMLHNSISNNVSNNFEEYRKFMIITSDLYINNFIFFMNLVHSQKAISYINSKITGAQIYKYIYGINETPHKLINYIINNTNNSIAGLKHRIEFSLLCILIRVYPRFRKYINEKMWNSHDKWAEDII